MKLGQKQKLFSRLTIQLYQFIIDEGYEFTYGDAYRDERVHGQMGESKGYEEIINKVFENNKNITW